MGVSHYPTRTWKQRWLPHPLLSLSLIYLWTALMDDFKIGSLLLGAILGVIIPIVTRNIWDANPKMGSVGLMVWLAVVVLWDIMVANVQVAMTILFRPVDRLQPQWFAVPLDLQSREAIAILASTVSLTPGTVSCDLSANGRSLLVHALNTSDSAAETAKIKRRYESRLIRIFE